MLRYVIISPITHTHVTHILIYFPFLANTSRLPFTRSVAVVYLFYYTRYTIHRYTCSPFSLRRCTLHHRRRCCRCLCSLDALLPCRNLSMKLNLNISFAPRSKNKTSDFKLVLYVPRDCEYTDTLHIKRD